MESFRHALDRLKRDFIAEVVAAVLAATKSQQAERQQREAKPKPTRIVRSSAPPAPEVQRPVVVRSFDIPVGVPRRRRRRLAGTSPAKKATPPPPPPQVVKFEVIPHPDRKNRRIVMTRLDSAEAPPSSSEG
jgi:hypothetical protein